MDNKSDVFLHACAHNCVAMSSCALFVRLIPCALWAQPQPPDTMLIARSQSSSGMEVSTAGVVDFPWVFSQCATIHLAVSKDVGALRCPPLPLSVLTATLRFLFTFTQTTVF